MFKKSIITLLVLFSLITVCFAGPGDTMKASIDYTTDQLVHTGKINLYGLFFILDGANSVTVNLYDGINATGKTLVPQFVFSPDGFENYRTIGFNPPLQLFTGCYVDITTTGTTTYKVYYNLDNL